MRTLPIFDYAHWLFLGVFSCRLPASGCKILSKCARDGSPPHLVTLGEIGVGESFVRNDQLAFLAMGDEFHGHKRDLVASVSSRPGEAQLCGWINHLIGPNMFVDLLLAAHGDVKRTADPHIELGFGGHNVSRAHPFAKSFRIGPRFIYDFARHGHSAAHYHTVFPVSGRFHGFSSLRLCTVLTLCIFALRKLPRRPDAAPRIARIFATTRRLRAVDEARSSSDARGL